MGEINMGKVRRELFERAIGGKDWTPPAFVPNKRILPEIPDNWRPPDEEPEEHVSALGGLDKEIEQIIDETVQFTPSPEMAEGSIQKNPFEDSEKTPPKLHILFDAVIKIQGRIDYLLKNKILLIEDENHLIKIRRGINTLNENLRGMSERIHREPNNQSLIQEIKDFTERTKTTFEHFNTELEWLHTNAKDKPKI